MPQGITNSAEYSNALGFVADDFFCIKVFGAPTFFSFDSVLKVKFVKQRNNLVNLIFLNLSILFLGALFYFKIVSPVLKAVLFFMSSCFILLTFQLKKYSYEVIVFTKTTNSTRIRIAQKQKGQAVDIVGFISLAIDKKS
ncbi:hypothetical protein KIH23_07755 [Flavobacterium sp. CYK-55]|uniref:hypothetical protein n=1 Tax=Flavobacterium sp. CYK-55 TaxID=2835529 RepID=UPI001BCDF5BC|nr:hypothetical protein [Flavobacterium sp. CYK-55]MBS7787190.1 hypothetical protein [Flavobacterium sp. CYK-55]